MSIVFTASRLMKAWEVQNYCRHLKGNQEFVSQVEMAAKEQLGNQLLQKEKAASAGTLTAAVH